MLRAFLAIATTCALACGGQPRPTSSPAQAPPQSSAPPPLTAEQCKAQGGEVVGDIGDGAIHRPDYRCPNSGQPPLGTIASQPGEPVAVEGAVCCR